MAVCGRCVICGHKFSGSGDDEAVRWTCETCSPRIDESVDKPLRVIVEPREHAICAGCHDLLVGDTVPNAVNDLLALIRERRGS